MGWDAHAVKRLDEVDLLEINIKTGHFWIPERKLRKAFKKAANKVERLTGAVDCLLEKGGLDTSDAADMLELITGINAWGEDLSPEEVGRLAIMVFVPEPGYETAYHSALKFLEVCKDHHLGMRFSW